MYSRELPYVGVDVAMVTTGESGERDLESGIRARDSARKGSPFMSAPPVCNLNRLILLHCLNKVAFCRPQSRHNRPQLVSLFTALAGFRMEILNLNAFCYCCCKFFKICDENLLSLRVSWPVASQNTCYQPNSVHGDGHPI